MGLGVAKSLRECFPGVSKAGSVKGCVSGGCYGFCEVLDVQRGCAYYCVCPTPSSAREDYVMLCRMKFRE